jgi:SAM-dependent methyltransferase
MRSAKRSRHTKLQNTVRPKDTVIDFGCGSGALLDLLPAGRKLGVEVSEQARQLARSRGYEVYTSSAELPAEIADVVISNHALEHTLHPRAELAELHRSLRPGGTFVLWLPLDDWRVQRSPSPDLDKDHHLYTWTPRLIGNLLRESSFNVGSAKVVSDAWPPRRAYSLYQALPRPLFRGLSFFSAVALRRRQLHVVAHKP